MQQDNIIQLNDGERTPWKEVFTFTAEVGIQKVTVEVPPNGPPLTVALTVYMLSNAIHQIHRMMEP